MCASSLETVNPAGTTVLDSLGVTCHVHTEITLHMMPSAPAHVRVRWVRKVRAGALECAEHSVYGVIILEIVDVEWLQRLVWRLAIFIRTACWTVEETLEHLHVSLDAEVWLVLVNKHEEHLCFGNHSSKYKNTFS